MDVGGPRRILKYATATCTHGRKTSKLSIGVPPTLESAKSSFGEIDKPIHSLFARTTSRSISARTLALLSTWADAEHLSIAFCYE